MGAEREMDEEWKGTGIRTVVIRELQEIARRYGVRKVVLFGSRARGSFRRDSDIDLAVLGGDAVLFRMAAEEETSTLLKFDVVDLNHGIQVSLEEEIAREGKIIYEEI